MSSAKFLSAPSTYRPTASLHVVVLDLSLYMDHSENILYTGIVDMFNSLRYLA